MGGTALSLMTMLTQNLASSLTDLGEWERETVFLYVFRRLAAYRNTIELYALTEAALLPPSRCFNEFSQALNEWGQSTLENAWVACQEPGEGGEYIVRLAGSRTSQRRD